MPSLFASFALTWLALGIYTGDAIRRVARRRAPAVV
jgi:hypothetical protein